MSWRCTPTTWRWSWGLSSRTSSPSCWSRRSATRAASTCTRSRTASLHFARRAAAGARAEPDVPVRRELLGAAAATDRLRLPAPGRRRRRAARADRRHPELAAGGPGDADARPRHPHRAGGGRGEPAHAADLRRPTRSPSSSRCARCSRAAAWAPGWPAGRRGQRGRVSRVSPKPVRADAVVRRGWRRRACSSPSGSATWPTSATTPASRRVPRSIRLSPTGWWRTS